MSGRSKGGWKLSPEELREFYSIEDHKIIGDSKAPVRVTVVHRLKDDLAAMTVLLSGDVPYCVPVRVGKNGWMGYGMGDASGDGFGATFYIDGALFFRYGQWVSSISEVFFNYRELRNLVEALKKHVREGVSWRIVKYFS